MALPALATSLSQQRLCPAEHTRLGAGLGQGALAVSDHLGESCRCSGQQGWEPGIAEPLWGSRAVGTRGRLSPYERDTAPLPAARPVQGGTVSAPLK